MQAGKVVGCRQPGIELKRFFEALGLDTVGFSQATDRGAGVRQDRRCYGKANQVAKFSAKVQTQRFVYLDVQYNDEIANDCTG